MGAVPGIKGFVYDITYSDGSSATVKPGHADAVAYELEFDEAVIDAFASRKLRWQSWMAWHSLKRREGETREYDDWLQTVEGFGVPKSDIDVEAEADGEAGDGDPPAPGDDPAPDS